MIDYELCINQNQPGGGERYATLDDATVAAEGMLLLDPDPNAYATIFEHTIEADSDESVTVYDSRWPEPAG